MEQKYVVGVNNPNKSIYRISNIELVIFLIISNIS